MGGSAFQEDLAHYGGRVRWSDRALWAIAVYRLGRRILAVHNETVRRLLLIPFLPLARFVETITRTSLPVFADIGGGLRIPSCGMIFIHSDVVIGRNCTLCHGVTVGNTRENGATPILGDDVEIGAYAQILGSVRVGDRVKIASMTVVLQDVPAGSVVFGIPARIRTGDAAASGVSCLNRGGSAPRPD